MVRQLIHIIFDEGILTILIGPPDAGKSNLAVVFMKLLVEAGYHVWTNIHFFRPEQIELAKKRRKLADIPDHVYIDKPPQIHVVGKLSTLLLGLLTPGRHATILDEAGIISPSDSPMSKDTKSMKQLARIIRHFDSSLLLATQSEGSIPPDLRKKLVQYKLDIRGNNRIGRRLKIGKRAETTEELTGEHKIVFPTLKKHGKLKNIPPAKYPYDGKFYPKFVIDIDLKKALDLLGDEELNSLDIVEGGMGKKLLKQLIDETKIETKYVSTGKYAKKYGVTPKTIRVWANEGKVDFIRLDSGRFRILDKPPRLNGIVG